MTSIIKGCFAFLLFFILSIFVFGQNDELATQKLLWRTRAETISGNLLKESFKINEIQRALLFAKLGDLWWKADTNQSNNWFEKSVDTVFFYSPDESKTDKKEYFETVRNILTVIADRNQKQSNRLIKILSETAKNSENETESNADALIKYALQIVKDDPAKAAQIGSLALRVGHPKEFYKLIWELRRNSRPLADQLFNEAFSIAKTSRHYDLLQGVQLAVLPESTIYDFPLALSASPPQKLEVLNFFADYILQLQTSYTAKIITSCSTEAILISRSRMQFETLLPQKAGIVRQAVDVCLDKKTQGAFENLEKPSKDLNIQELLDLADESKDNPIVRMGYLTKAVILANNQKKYALVIKIVNSLTKEDLAEDAEFWEQMRYDASGNLAFIQFKEGDLQNFDKTLEDVPTAYRPFAQMVFVLQFPAEDKSSYSHQIEVLNNARTGFIKSEKPFTLKSDYWFQLVKLYSKHKLNEDASGVFREIIKAYNLTLSEKEHNQTLIASGIIASVFSPTFLETQENSIFETVNLANEPTSRVNIYLALLKISLQKYKSLNDIKIKQDSRADNLDKDG